MAEIRPERRIAGTRVRVGSSREPMKRDSPPRERPRQELSQGLRLR
jgi:hypothetical protein